MGTHRFHIMPFVDATLQVQAVTTFKVTIEEETTYNNTAAISIVESLYCNADSVKRDTNYGR